MRKIPHVLKMAIGIVVVFVAVVLKWLLQLTLLVIEAIGEFCYVSLIDASGTNSPFGIYKAEVAKSTPTQAEEAPRTKAPERAKISQASPPRVNLKLIPKPSTVEPGWVIIDSDEEKDLREEQNVHTGIRRLVKISSGVVIVNDLEAVEAVND